MTNVLKKVDETTVSVREAADILGLRYHNFLHWIKTDRYGLRQHATKCGWGWVVSRAKVEGLKRELARQEG